MTTRRDFAAPVLDRLLTRIIKGASPGLDPLGQPLPPTSTTEVKVWAARRDFTSRDQLNIAPGQFFELSDTRVIVRAEGPAWDVGDTFTLEGESYTVRGVSQLGRSRHLELLART